MDSKSNVRPISNVSLKHIGAVLVSQEPQSFFAVIPETGMIADLRVESFIPIQAHKLSTSPEVFLNPDSHETVEPARSVEGAHELPHTAAMSDITRYELDAKLETIEARMDGRVASIEGKIDGFLSAQVERDKRLDEQFAASNRDMARLSNMKANIWGAMVTAIVILVSVGALTLTAFQAGTAKEPSPIESVQQDQDPSPTPSPPQATSAK